MYALFLSKTKVIEYTPGTVSNNYVEFDQGIFTTRSDTRGSVLYTLEGTEHSFRLHIKDQPSRISVEYASLETTNNPRGSSFELGWRHDGIVSFVLSGKQGSFHSTNPPVDWMQRNRTTLGNRPLSQICILGTHDAGMSVVSQSAVPGGLINDYVLTQSSSILGQLIYGSRYFDIRPQISGGQFWTGHYTGKLGGRGESLASIIDGVNQFLSQSKELVILNFSHTLQSDIEDWRGFNNDEWFSLMQELTKLQHRFKIADQTKAHDLSLFTLDQFIGNGSGAVLCVMEDNGLDLKQFATEGFYKPAQLNVYNEYSDKDDAVVMINDQIDKMKKHMSVDDKQLFLLSWTLTQQVPEWDGNVFSLATKVLNFLKPIRTLAYTANKLLVQRLLPEVGRNAFPNVIYIDFLDSFDYLALTMAVNDKVFNN